VHKIDLLKNGIKVVTKPMDHMESVSIGVWLRTGGRYEDKATNGISHLLEHLLFKGTKTRDMKSIKEAIEGRGGSFNGFTSEEFTCYLVKVLAKDAELGVDILSDMVLNPRLDALEIEKEKSVIIEEINMYKDIPAQHVHEILAEMMWPDQPLGMPLAGSVESVKSITRDTLAAYKEKHYNPRNMIVVGAGKVGGEDFLRLSKKFLEHAKPAEESHFSKARLDQKSPVFRLHVKDTEQTHVALGLHTLHRFHPDKYIASLLNVILGANMSSRLFHIVRDEMALCYEISSGVRRYEDCGAFTVSAGVDHKKFAKALEVILRELGRMAKEPVGKEELFRAREYYRGQLLFALEDTMSHMLWMGEKIAAGEADIDIKDILAKVEKVKAEDIMRVASGIFKTGNLNLAVISPLKEEKNIKEMLHFS